MDTTVSNLKLNPERKALWVEALLSGKYKQTQDKLRDKHDGFCCLGVACDIHANHNPNPENVWVPLVRVGYSYHACTGGLSYQVCDWFGISVSDPLYIDVPEDVQKDYMVPKVTSLIKLNDSGVPFKIIAKLIQEQL